MLSEILITWNKQVFPHTYTRGIFDSQYSDWYHLRICQVLRYRKLHLPEFSIPHASGCKPGKRTISAHTYALEELGVKIKTLHEKYQIESPVSFKPREIIMVEAGDTACENILMAASKNDKTNL